MLPLSSYPHACPLFISYYTTALTPNVRLCDAESRMEEMNQLFELEQVNRIKIEAQLEQLQMHRMSLEKHVRMHHMRTQKAITYTQHSATHKKAHWQKKRRKLGTNSSLLKKHAISYLNNSLKSCRK